jgi:hypothetical protein
MMRAVFLDLMASSIVSPARYEHEGSKSSIRGQFNNRKEKLLGYMSVRA